MFTGIITHTTSVKKSAKTKDGLVVSFARPKDWKDLVLGESIATNGVCLTVAKLNSDSYDCLLMPETLNKTSFGHEVPLSVNLERSMGASDRFGGHFVQGHVDTTGEVTKIDAKDGYRLSVKFPKEFGALVIYKGSIAINGVSLTVADLKDNVLTVALIPHTLKVTTLDQLKTGDKVNLEFDMMAKYAANMLAKK